MLHQLRERSRQDGLSGRGYVHLPWSIDESGLRAARSVACDVDPARYRVDHAGVAGFQLGNAAASSSEKSAICRPAAIAKQPLEGLGEKARRPPGDRRAPSGRRCRTRRTDETAALPCLSHSRAGHGGRGGSSRRLEVRRSSLDLLASGGIPHHRHLAASSRWAAPSRSASLTGPTGSVPLPFIDSDGHQVRQRVAPCRQGSTQPRPFAFGQQQRKVFAEPDAQRHRLKEYRRYPGGAVQPAEQLRGEAWLGVSVACRGAAALGRTMVPPQGCAEVLARVLSTLSLVRSWFPRLWRCPRRGPLFFRVMGLRGLAAGAGSEAGSDPTLDVFRPVANVPPKLT